MNADNKHMDANKIMIEDLKLEMTKERNKRISIMNLENRGLEEIV